MSIPNDLIVGSRIQVGKDRATIKFIGSVLNSKGEWLGVEWDDSTRGKHDGTHQGNKYFDCRSSTSGSFIRYHAEKVKTGITFMDALKYKYLEEDDYTRVKEGQKYDPTKDHGELYFGGNKQIVVETVGFEKIQRAQRELSKLKVVGLAELLIYSAGEKNEIAETNLTIEDLDLSRNLISNWQTIFDIVSQLPNLKILRLNQLRLSSPPSDIDYQFINVKTLALNQTLMTWTEIDLILKVFPNLEDIQLGSNEISTTSLIQHSNLKQINLEFNLISDWKQVANFGTLPNLETLFLNDNKLTTVEKPADRFTKLEYLRIERNAIDNWDSFDALNQFQSLSRLRCKENPIFKDMNKELETAQIVGRIKNLTVVNGNTLTNRERIDLERFYLNNCTKDGTTHEAISLIHPRYKELCLLHGEPNLQVQTKEASATLKNRLINIHFTIREDISTEIQYRKDLPPITKSITKKFLPSMTIRNIKHLLQRLLKIPSTNQHLYLLQTIENMENRDIIMMDISDDLRDLKFYGINENDEIIIIVI